MQPTENQSVPRPKRRTRLTRLAARVVFAIVVFLLTLEGCLRLVGFEFREYITRVRENQFKTDIAEFNPDLHALWAPIPGTGGFNKLGYIGSELPQTRTAGTVRIACLGDSCTQIGSPAYPERVARMLDARGYAHVEMMNWGVAGYSSFQGLVRLEDDVLAYRPDIYTFYFGWNDHWIQSGQQDDLAAIGPTSGISLPPAIMESRVAQAGDFIAEAFRTRPTQFRVPLAAYRDNLRRMIRLARESGGQVVLITAPGCLGDDRPIRLHLIGLESLGYRNAAAVHADYVTATREVAAEMHAAVFDAAKYFSETIQGCDYFVPERDPVHLTDGGLGVIAEQLTEQLIRTGWLDGALNGSTRRFQDTAPGICRASSERPVKNPMNQARVRMRRERIAEFYRRHHIRKLAIFGSALRDDFGPQSDIDLLVEFSGR